MVRPPSTAAADRGRERVCHARRGKTAFGWPNCTTAPPPSSAVMPMRNCAAGRPMPKRWGAQPARSKPVRIRLHRLSRVAESNLAAFALALNRRPTSRAWRNGAADRHPPVFVRAAACWGNRTHHPVAPLTMHPSQVTMARPGLQPNCLQETPVRFNDAQDVASLPRKKRNWISASATTCR